ncbi:MAG: primosomal protein N' [Actinobacteria bacterium]|nr:primosomal protein N' [Actinomycetota bacterium]
MPVWRVDKPFSYSVPETLADLAPGNLVRVRFGGRSVRGIVISVAPECPRLPLEPVLGAVVGPPLAPPPLLQLIRWTTRRYAAPPGRTLRRVVPPRVRVEPLPPCAISGGPPGERLPTYKGGDGLIAAIERGLTGTWALRWRSGEDRAAAIGELVAAAGRAGGAALVCVPEVRYGSSVLEGLHGHFPELARVDSAMGAGDRSRSWLRLASGHALGGGGRAAVLAPTPSLRLIVLDEEHHRTYKEDRSPAYDSRRVAVERARLQEAVCVLASSCPSVEVGAQALWGRIGSAAPSREASRAARPIIELLGRPEGGALATDLHHRINDTLRRGARVALLTTSRGYARTIWCAMCRRSLRCPRCEAGVASQQGRAEVACPRCGWSASAPAACPSCGADDFRLLGAGSERLAEQVRLSFPRAAVARIDPDVIEEPRDALAADIYVTTWIGTKAAIRPPVELVGVLDADALIRRPHWRAAESAYQALSEMAEWAGPASEGGRLVIQCSEPGHHALQGVARADYGYFLERELPGRAELLYPPYRELIKATASGPARSELLDAVGETCRRAGALVLGPIPSAPNRGREAREALELLVKCADAGEVAAELRGILASVPSGSRLGVDVDPR